MKGKILGIYYNNSISKSIKLFTTELGLQNIMDINNIYNLGDGKS